MKIPAWIRNSSRQEIIIYIIIAFVVAEVCLQTLAALGILPPLSIDDFVVDSHENIVVASAGHHRIYYISKEGRLLDTIGFPLGNGGVTMAIDVSDNIYINRRRNVEVYSLKNAPKIYGVNLDKTDDWLLTEGNKVVNLNRSLSYEHTNCSFGNRRPVNLGEFLFYNSTCGQGWVHFTGAIYEFNTLTNIYRVNLWGDTVSVYNSQGRFLYNVQISPNYLRVFAFPIPFMVIMLIFASVIWLTDKIAMYGIHIPLDFTIIIHAIFGLLSFAIVAFIIMTIIPARNGNLNWLPYALAVILFLVSLLFVRNLISVWAHLTLQFILMFVSILISVDLLLTLKGWAAFAAMVPWPVRLVALLIAAGIAALLSGKIGALVLRIKCPINDCHGWCKMQDHNPITFLCNSCKQKYITSIFIGRRR